MFVLTEEGKGVPLWPFVFYVKKVTADRFPTLGIAFSSPFTYRSSYTCPNTFEITENTKVRNRYQFSIRFPSWKWAYAKLDSGAIKARS